jgi:hypothetical protein
VGIGAVKLDGDFLAVEKMGAQVRSQNRALAVAGAREVPLKVPGVSAVEAVLASTTFTTKIPTKFLRAGVKRA